MSLRLRAGLSWCVCRGRSAFLDLDRARYFCLSEATDMRFRRWVAGAVDAETVAGLVAAGLLESGQSGKCAPVSITLPSRCPLAGDTGAPLVMDVAVAAAAQIWAWLSLRLGPIARVVAISARRPGAGEGPDDAAAMGLARAFDRVALLLRSEDQCLPRALAMHRLCARRNLAATLVFGVRLDPFAAHCWVQAGDTVLVGDLEQIRLFTPILVVP